MRTGITGFIGSLSDVADRSSFWRWSFAGIFLAGTFGLLMGGYFPTGYFHDDAIYWLLSQSLLRGHYTLPSDPVQAVPSNYLPGYPLFLVLAGGFRSFFLARAISWTLSIGTWLVAAVLFRRRPESETAKWAWAWFVLQPIPLRYAATALSEPLCVFLILVCFWFYESLPFEVQKKDWALILLVGYGCWVRPVGALLGLSFLADSLLRGNRRRALLFFLGLLVFQGGLSFWSASEGQGASSFLGQWRTALNGAPVSVFVSLVFRNLSYYANLVSFMVVFPLGKWFSRVQSVPGLTTLLVAAVSAAILYGWFLTWKSPRRAWSIFFLFNTGLISLWLRPDPRYLWPVLFMVPLFFIQALDATRTLVKGVSFDRTRGLALLGTVLCLAVNARGVAGCWRGERPRLPEDTYRWIKAHLPDDAVLASANASTLYLYTGRRGTDFLRTYEPEEFLNHLLSRKVTHVLLENEAAGESPNLPDVNDWTPVARMMTTHACWFGVVSGFPKGTMSLYALSVNANGFQEAYQRYVEGVKAWNTGNAKEAENRFKAALQRQPDMVGAYDRLAQMAFVSGNASTAESYLQEALRIWPSNLLALFHSWQMRSRMPGAQSAIDMENVRALARKYAYWPLLWRMDSLRKSKIED